MIFSATFYAHGIFDGTDQLPVLNDQHGSAAPLFGIGIEPWEDVPINIVCVDITFFQMDSRFVNYAFAGNGFSPDVMRWWGEPNPIPPGESFPCPAKGSFTMTKSTHLDLHVSGQAGQKWQGYYSVYYTKNGALPLAQANALMAEMWDGQNELG